jgi:hypothetical protein
VRNGLTDFERAHWPRYETALEIEQAPAEWFEDAEAIGYVTVRVLREGKTELKTPMACFFLGICDPAPHWSRMVPGVGLAWVHVARNQLACPIEPVQLVRQAMDSPGRFFQGVGEDELPELSRLILSSEPALEAWHLHALFAAVEQAGIHVRAPYRLFHALMKAAWLPTGLKREFCRGLLGCSPYYERLREWSANLIASIRSDPDRFFEFPRIWLEVAQIGLDIRVPGLRRHAVTALVDAVGEPPLEVIHEFLLRRKGKDPDEEMVHRGALDVVSSSAGILGPDRVRGLLNEAIRRGSAAVRQQAYRIGLEQFGPSFALPAFDDSARSVRNWAAKALGKCLHS